MRKWIAWSDRSVPTAQRENLHRPLSCERRHQRTLFNASLQPPCYPYDYSTAGGNDKQLGPNTSEPAA
jgi:hypothetical protein